MQRSDARIGGADVSERTSSIVDELGHLEGPLLPILHELQAEFGHLPDGALKIVADRLNISRAEMHGVATFYHDFRSAPAGRHVLKLCGAEACQSMGGEAVSARAAAALGIRPGETARDGSVTLETVYCLGLCACAPAAMVDGRVVGRLDAGKLDAILADCRR